MNNIEEALTGLYELRKIHMGNNDNKVAEYANKLEAAICVIKELQVTEAFYKSLYDRLYKENIELKNKVTTQEADKYSAIASMNSIYKNFSNESDWAPSWAINNGEDQFLD